MIMDINLEGWQILVILLVEITQIKITVEGLLYARHSQNEHNERQASPVVDMLS
jgi:hypothetical protein